MKKSFMVLLVLTALGVVLFSLPGLAQTERILSFHSAIKVHQDSTMTVRETIKVRAAGRDIKRGIYRDFPTRYRDHQGNNYVVGFQVLGVERDGQPESYHLQGLSNGQRVYIGKKEVFLSSGVYTYTLTYKTNRQLGFFEEHDELYWNVTGNGWSFPIDQAQARVELPEFASQYTLDQAGYTGPAGSRARNVSISSDGKAIVFTTTRSLGPREGLTIVVSWPKGYVSEPDSASKLAYFLRDNLSLLLGVVGLFVLLGYYLLVWNQVGRDPAKGVIIPLYTPPPGFSPQACRYLMKMEFDHKTLTAAIINMAVKGYFTIEEEGDTYIIKKTGHAEPALDKEERSLARKLLCGGGEIKLHNTSHNRISTSLKGLKRSLGRKLEKIYFFSNKKYFFPGLALSLVLLLLVLFYTATSLPVVILAMILAGVNPVFYHLLKAPTLRGRQIMDKLEGFKMYLATAERDRLNLLNPPDKTPELFERYLPYALALDVEQAWAEQFSDLLARAGQEPYQPSWYHGSSWQRLGVRSFCSNLGSSFSSAVSSSAVAPGSSSGIGGGGFSGGGGGGGGGGGW